MKWYISIYLLSRSTIQFDSTDDSPGLTYYLQQLLSKDMDASDFNLHFRAASPQIPTTFDTLADAYIVQSHEPLIVQTVFDPSKTLNAIIEFIGYSSFILCVSYFSQKMSFEIFIFQHSKFSLQNNSAQLAYFQSTRILYYRTDTGNNSRMCSYFPQKNFVSLRNLTSLI